MKGKNQVIKHIINLIDLDIKYDLLSKEFCHSLEKEHRRLVRLNEKGEL